MFGKLSCWDRGVQLYFCKFNLIELDLKKLNISSTLRRIGEEIFKSYTKNSQIVSENALVAVKSSDSESNEENKDIDNRCKSSISFLKSDNFKIRLLSCLIVLRTSNQGEKLKINAYCLDWNMNNFVSFLKVDYINNVFEILKQDLKHYEVKKLFLDYYGTWTILKWCKLTNKVCSSYFS